MYLRADESPGAAGVIDVDVNVDIDLEEQREYARACGLLGRSGSR